MFSARRTLVQRALESTSMGIAKYLGAYSKSLQQSSCLLVKSDNQVGVLKCGVHQLSGNVQSSKFQLTHFRD